MKWRGWITVLLYLLLSQHQESVRAASVKLNKPLPRPKGELRALPQSEVVPVSHPGIISMKLVSRPKYVPESPVMVGTERDPASEGREKEFNPLKDVERVFEEREVQYITSEELKTTLSGKEEHFTPSEDLKTTPKWEDEHVPTDLNSGTQERLTPSLSKNPVKYSTFFKTHRKGNKKPEGKYELVAPSGNKETVPEGKEGAERTFTHSGVKGDTHPVKYFTFRSKDQGQDTPVGKFNLTQSSKQVNKHMTRDLDTSTTTPTTTTTRTKRPTNEKPGRSTNTTTTTTTTNPSETHDRKPGEVKDRTGDQQLSHGSGDSSLLTHLLTHLLHPSPHHHHHHLHHLSQPSAGERSVWNKKKNARYFKLSDTGAGSRQRRDAIRRKREEVEWPVEVQGGAKEMDMESGRQLVQNTVALITANPALVLVFAFSIWMVWAVAVGFDPITYLNSFGTGAPGGGGSGGGGGGVVSSSSASAVVIGALNNPPPIAVPQPALLGEEGSIPVPAGEELSPDLLGAEPSPDAEAPPAEDGGTPDADSGGSAPDGDEPPTDLEPPAGEEPAVESPAAGEDPPADEESPADSPPADEEQSVDSPPADEEPPAGDEQPVDSPPADEESPADSPPADSPPADDTTVDESAGGTGGATGSGVLFAEAISDATTTEGEAGSLTPAFASLRPSSTTGTTEEALLAVDGAIWEILANISSSITTTESTDGENSPPKLPPLPVPTGDLTGSSATSSYSVLHACLVLGGDVPSCVAQAAAFGQILQNKTQDSQDSLPRPTSEDVTPSSLGTILKIHPFAEVLHSLQDGDLGSQDAVIDKTPLGNVSAGNNVILGFLRNQNVSQDMVEKVISQVNFIKDTFKDSQVLIPWKDSEDKVDISEGSSNNTQGQKNSGDLTENSDNLQQISEDLPKNPDGEKNQETFQITPDLPQINSDPPKLYSSNEALALTDNKDDTPFSSIMLQGELSVKDKENEKKGGDKKDKISEEDKMKEELKKKKEEEEKVEKEEEEKEGIKREKTGLTDRRGFLIKSKYPHAQIVPIKPIRLHMRQR